MFGSEQFWWGVICGWILFAIVFLICFFIFWLNGRFSRISPNKKSNVAEKKSSNIVLNGLKSSEQTIKQTVDFSIIEITANDRTPLEDLHDVKEGLQILQKALEG